MWDMVLSYSRAFPASWHATNARKAVLPRLYSFLRCVPQEKRKKEDKGKKKEECFCSPYKISKV